ncbi:MAG TPA: hypothetical protein VHB53_13985 [Solirubrobacterales bacterium]|nr:hypothetical protein [Solirubrobacterales bacterium]
MKEIDGGGEMSDRETVTAPDARAAIGPCTHAARHGDVVHRGGALPLAPTSGEMVDDPLAVDAVVATRR